MSCLPKTDELIKSVATEFENRGYEADADIKIFKPLSLSKLSGLARKTIPASVIMASESTIDNNDIMMENANQSVIKARKEVLKSIAKETVEKAILKAIDEHVSEQIQKTSLDYDSSVDMVLSGGQQMINYIFDHFNGDRSGVVKLFLASRIFDPIYISSITMSFALELLKDLRFFPSITSDLLSGLELELPRYKEAAHKHKAAFPGLKECEDILGWHFKYSGRYGKPKDQAPDEFLKSGQRSRPRIFEAACLLVLILPTCASADRVFSILNSRFSKSMAGSLALADYVMASVMLSFNDRNP